MFALTVPNVGAEIALKAFLNHTGQTQNLYMDLYTNNVTIAEGDTKSTYTIASGSGYAGPKTLTGSSWTVSTGDPVTATYAAQTYTWSGVPGTATMYGYLVYRSTGNELCWAEGFTSAPYTIVNAGDTIVVTPRITAD